MANFYIRAALALVLFAAGGAGTARAQQNREIIDAINQARQEKFEHEKELQAERLKSTQALNDAQAELLHAQAQALLNGPGRQGTGASGYVSSSSAGGQYFLPLDRESLAAVDPATYRMSNGIVLQVTGLFQPYAPTVCIANCP